MIGAGKSLYGKARTICQCTRGRNEKEVLVNNMFVVLVYCEMKTFLGKGHVTKSDEFPEKFQRGGGVIFNPNIYILQILGTSNRAL